MTAPQPGDSRFGTLRIAGDVFVMHVPGAENVWMGDIADASGLRPLLPCGEKVARSAG
jgi:hypothetical protein